MNANDINKLIDIVNQALEWTPNVPQSGQLSYKRKLINKRRELKKIQYAICESCSTAAFGESQMGKSYLVSAMLSSPSKPFSVTNESSKYDFINEINPSRPNSTIESTGVITRFSTKIDRETPKGYLKVSLLSVADIILILCEAYYNQVNYPRENIISKESLNEILSNTSIEQDTPVSYLCDDDILDIREYISNSPFLQMKCHHILESELFNFLIININNLGDSQLSEVVQLLWNRDYYINKLWLDLLSTYKKLDYTSKVYAQFNSVLKRKGTLLDVARLDEMYGEPEDIGSEYEPYLEVKIMSNGEDIKTEKSFFSALISELSFTLPKDLEESHPFLKNLDILDFPGARRPEQISQSKLGEGKNLSTILRRGKVSYLFNKYSSAKRINTLLFCHNNSMSGESSMGGLLDSWVNGNIGSNDRDREEYMKISSVPPLFIIGTWFNKDLEYQEEIPNDTDTLNARWNRRFNVVLEKEVLKSLGDGRHWFNNWSTSTKPFQNIYMLRDFKYSKAVYDGYDPKKGAPESGKAIVHSNYPSFFNDLKQSFINNEFVKTHFISPTESWDDAATCAMDGSLKIIKKLNTIAPNVSKAREEKFKNDIKQIISSILNLLEPYYHPDNSGELFKLAKRQSGQAIMQLDRLQGRDPYSFGKLMDTLMVSESEVYELVHSLTLGEEQNVPMSNEESLIFMSAGLDSNASREENIERLCIYLGVDDEKECIEALEPIDINKLLSQRHMMSDKADNVVKEVENLWFTKVLTERTTRMFEEELQSISTIVSYLWKVYKLTDLHTQLVYKVREYINNIDKETSIGIISDYLSMMLNKFSSTFGYSYITDGDKENIQKKNNELKLGINYKDLNTNNESSGLELLSELYIQREVLSGSSFSNKDRDFLSKFPQFRHVWKWEQQLKVGYIYACELPDYDIQANDKLKSILENLKH